MFRDNSDYMRRFVLGWRVLGRARRFGSAIVNYADDLCVLGKAPAAEMLATVERLMADLKLAVNERKTRCLWCPEEAVEFLGYRMGRIHRPTGKGSYIGTRPGKASVQSICRRISEATTRHYGLLASEVVVERLNRTVTGWANYYFSLGHVSPAYGVVHRHAVRRLRQWLCGKHKWSYPVYAKLHIDGVTPQGEVREICAFLGPEAAARLRPRSPDAADHGPSEREGMILSESRVREIGMHGSMSGDWKRGHGSRTEARSESNGTATLALARQSSTLPYFCRLPVLRSRTTSAVDTPQCSAGDAAL